MDDATLLREFVEERSEAAFAEVVRRYLNLVYSAAVRQVGDRQLAEDVAQTVFADLARKARPLSRHPMLQAWLYTSTHYAAAKAVRAERRRRQREHISYTMNSLLESDPGDAAWARIGPVLDGAMHELGERDRRAVLLRFFEGRPLAQVGAQLGLSEDAAQKRVARALDELRGKLERRGVTSTAAAIGAALGSQAISAAPASLVSSVTATSVAESAALAAGGLKLATTFMSTTKIQAAAAVVILAIAASGLFMQAANNRELTQQVALLREKAAAPLPEIAPAPVPVVVDKAAAPAPPVESPPIDYATLHQQLQELIGLRDQGLTRVNLKVTDLTGAVSAKVVEMFGLTQEQAAAVATATANAHRSLGAYAAEFATIAPKQPRGFIVTVPPFIGGEPIRAEYMKALQANIAPEVYGDFVALMGDEIEWNMDYFGAGQKQYAFSPAATGQFRYNIISQWIPPAGKTKPNYLTFSMMSDFVELGQRQPELAWMAKFQAELAKGGGGQ